MYYLAAFALAVIGMAHSYLGERYILMRLFRRNNLPKLYGGTEFTKNTIRFAWHLTTVAWFGFAAIIIHMASSPVNTSMIGNTIGVVFIIHGCVALVGSKGKHFVWPFFLLVGAIVLYGSNT